jgi:GT2 family glycosyltransferase/peptidoglycan/LPS O-acetylase OafA/YrhL
MTLLEKFAAVSFKGPGFGQIRFAAALLVVAHHAWWGTHDLLYGYSGGLIHAGLFAVIVFFCLSGFLVTPSLARSGDTIKFATHRMLRIFPALIVVVAASMLLLGPIATRFTWAEYFTDRQFYLYAKNILTLTAHFLPGVAYRDGEPAVINGALWTLNIEVASYIALAVLGILGVLRHRSLVLAVFLVAYAIYVLPTFDAASAVRVPPRFATFISLFVYFIAGAALFLYSDRIPFSGRLAACAFVVAMAGMPAGLGAIVLPICLPYLVVCLGLCAIPGQSFFQRDLSYGVYLIHSPVLVAITLWLGMPSGWPAATITAAITLILAFLSWTYVEEPALRRKKVVSDWLTRLVRGPRQQLRGGNDSIDATSPGRSSPGDRSARQMETASMPTDMADRPVAGRAAPKVSVIIVSYNTRDMTLECLQSIVTQTRDVSYEIIVIDNNSSDGSSDAIRRQFPDLKLIALTENVGFARANNLAAKEARGERLLLLNPDTVILDRAIDKLIAFADQTPSFHVWGGRTLYGDGRLNPTSCWRRITLWNLTCFALGLTYFARRSPLLNSESYGGWDRDTTRHVDIVTGCFFLIDHDLWTQLNGFDPTFFMYGEEADLCHRARQAGARPAITPSATIVHYGGASDSVPVDKRVKVFKGRITLINCHFSSITRGLGRRLHLLAVLTRWCGYRMAASLSDRAAFDQSAEYWRAVWRRRLEWINGYGIEHE